MITQISGKIEKERENGGQILKLLRSVKMNQLMKNHKNL